MTIPPYLKQGDKVGIAAPARKISEEELLPAVRFLEQEGLVPFYDERLFAECHQFAGDDSLRAAYMQDLLDNPDLGAVWCARGGYGTARIIDRLDFAGFRRNPKWIVGYSDVTVLHSHINRNLDTATLHAAMPIDIARGTDDARRSWTAALRGEPLHYEIPPHPLNRATGFTATIVGGNLSILYAMLATPSDLDTDGKVLFIEDLDEYLYHIDRMMNSLERSGRLRNLAALLVGHLSDMHDNTVPFGKNAEEIVAEHCAKYHFPVIFNVPAGHRPDNRALKMGCPLCCRIDGNAIILEQ